MGFVMQIELDKKYVSNWPDVITQRLCDVQISRTENTNKQEPYQESVIIVSYKDEKMSINCWYSEDENKYYGIVDPVKNNNFDDSRFLLSLIDSLFTGIGK